MTRNPSNKKANRQMSEQFPARVFLLTAVPLFMVTLDNLVVTTALPSIRLDLGAGLEGLQWTVNAYTLAFATFLLTAAALGDRLGRRRMFSVGLVVFTVASALAALSPNEGALVAARALQGLGAACIAPLSLTLLSEATTEGRRGLAIGLWSGVSGLGVALGPVVGGAIISGISWHWIFWVNVPIGLIVLPLVMRGLRESRGPNSTLDLPGLVLAAAGLLALTFGIVRAPALGWGSAAVVSTITVGVLTLAGFLYWESRSPAPMLPTRFFRSRAFSATNVVSFAMFFGTFGAIFFLAQFFQTVQGYSALQAGLRTLPWTAMPLLVAPVAGIFSDRLGARPLMAAGLALQAFAIGWIALKMDVAVPYSSLVPAFVAGGVGMALVFAPSANAVLASVRPKEAGQASGATNTIRELGGVMGIAILATAFSAAGSYSSPQTFVDGASAAMPIGAAVLVVGVIAALLVPRAGGEGGPVGSASPG